MDGMDAEMLGRGESLTESLKRDSRYRCEDILEKSTAHTPHVFKNSALVACPWGNTWWMGRMVDAEMFRRRYF